MCYKEPMKIFSIDDLITYLAKTKRFLNESFRVTRLGVFRSFVEDRHTHLSDVDMVVEFEEGNKNIHNFSDLKRLLANKFPGRSISVLNIR